MTRDFSNPALLARYWNELSNHIGRAPAWDVPDQIRGNDVIFRRLDFNNYREMVDLFEGDDDLFIDSRFRHDESTVEFLIGQLGDAAYSPDSGAVDYLIIDSPGLDTDYVQFTSTWLQSSPQLPPEARLAGVIHLYDLDQRNGKSQKTPKVGIMTAAEFRGTDLSARALKLMHTYARRNFNFTCVEAEIEKENQRSIRFFEKLGYKIQRERSDNVLMRLQIDEYH